MDKIPKMCLIYSNLGIRTLIGKRNTKGGLSVNLEERTQIENKVAQLNHQVKDSGIPQLKFDFEPTWGLLRLSYQSKPSFDLIAYIVSDYYLDLVDWLDYQESNLYLYVQLAQYFKGAFYRATMLEDNSLTLTLKGITYLFNYVNDTLVIVAYKYYEKDLTHLGNKVSEIALEKVLIPSERFPVRTRAILKRAIHETEVVENLDWIQNTFKSFEDMVVNQTVQIKEIPR